MKKVGLIVNPYAGIGAEQAAKGSDDPMIAQHWLQAGYKSEAPRRAAEALRRVYAFGRIPIALYVPPGNMGEDAAREAGIENIHVLDNHRAARTTADDTRRYVESMLHIPVDCLAVAGGDGTVRDVYLVLTKHKRNIPIITIPAGTKMRSGFPPSPWESGEILRVAVTFDDVENTHFRVQDVDEELYRRGKLDIVLHGTALTPYVPEIFVGSKDGSFEHGDSRYLAERFIRELLPGHDTLIRGPGSTTASVVQALGVDDFTRMGFDIVSVNNGDSLAIKKDATSSDILHYSRDRNPVCILSPQDGSGFLIGRGNQQLNAAAIRQMGRKNVVVIATTDKLRRLEEGMFAHTGDYDYNRKLQEELNGTWPVFTESGYQPVKITFGGETIARR